MTIEMYKNYNTKNIYNTNFFTQKNFPIYSIYYINIL